MNIELKFRDFTCEEKKKASVLETAWGRGQ